MYGKVGKDIHGKKKMRHVPNVKYKKRDENNNIRDENDNYNNNYSDDYERENSTNSGRTGANRPMALPIRPRKPAKPRAKPVLAVVSRSA